MPGTVVDVIRERAKAWPARPALVAGDRVLDYATLFERVDRLAAALAALGVAKGQAILAYLPNSVEAVECELAALQSGIAWITLSARLTWSEVRGVIASCEPGLVVTDAAGLERITDGTAALPSPVPLRVVVTGDAPPAEPDVFGYEALLAAHAPERPQVTVNAEDVARLRYTSGTTGNAKAAVLPHRVYHASLRNLRDVLGPFTENDAALHVAPLTHGSGAILYPVLYAGGVNHLLAHFDADAVLDEMERRRITVMFTVPTILSRLVSSDLERRDLSALRALVYGGAPMPEAQLQKAVVRLGPSLVQIYGMTEAPWPIAALRQSDHVPGSPRLASVGRPSDVCEVRVVDGDGNALPTGGAGEIQIRGENVMSGYHRDPEGTRAVLHDGWLSSGDVGRFDDDGYLYIVGRSKDVIISGGFNVYAAEVEAALSSHADVVEVAVVGLPHDEWGEEVAAFVVLAPGATVTTAEITAFARARLASYKCPKVVRIVSDLPKNPSGKIQKSALVRRPS